MGFVSLSDDLDNETQLSSQWLRYLSQEILPLSYLIRICRQWCGCDITHSPNIPNIAQWMYFFFFFFACMYNRILQLDGQFTQRQKQSDWELAAKQPNICCYHRGRWWVFSSYLQEGRKLQSLSVPFKFPVLQ